MLICPSCKTTIADGIAATGICPECGHLLNSGAAVADDRPADSIEATTAFGVITTDKPDPGATSDFAGTSDPGATLDPAVSSDPGATSDLASPSRLSRSALEKARSLLPETQEQPNPKAGAKTDHRLAATQELPGERHRSVSIAPRKLSMNDVSLITNTWGSAVGRDSNSGTSIKFDSKTSGMGSSLVVNPRGLRGPRHDSKGRRPRLRVAGSHR